MNSKLVPLLTSTIAGAVLAVASNASAQVVIQGSVGVSGGVAVPAPPPPPPPPVVVVQPVPPQPVYVQPRPVYVQQPRPVYVVGQPGYVQPYPQPYMEDRPRFRFGVDVGGGWLVFGPRLGGPAINFGVRGGVQINNLIAVYYQGNLPIGFASGRLQRSDGSEVEAVGAAVALTNTIAAELTFWNILKVALGPSLDYYFGGVGTRDGSTSFGTAGAFFGLNGRIAATFGSVMPGRRRSFSIGTDLHPTFTPFGVSFFATLNVGYEYH